MNYFNHQPPQLGSMAYHYATQSIRVDADRVVPSVAGAPTSAEFMISFWVRLKTFASDQYFIQETGNASILDTQLSDGKLVFQSWSGISGLTGSSIALGNDSWSHFIASVSVSNARAQIYVDGSSAMSVTPTGAGHNFSNTHGWFNYQTGAVAPVDAEIAEWYIHCSASLDLSVAANLQKFRSAAGKPVDLGADGSTPTGSQPHYYHRGNAASFLTNLGSLGDATVSHGALADGASSPSD